MCFCSISAQCCEIMTKERLTEAFNNCLVEYLRLIRSYLEALIDGLNAGAKKDAVENGSAKCQAILEDILVLDKRYQGILDRSKNLQLIVLLS